MASDIYTKGVLTAVALFLGIIAFEYSTAPQIIPTKPGMAPGYWIERDGKVRHCIHTGEEHQCFRYFEESDNLLNQ